MGPERRVRQKEQPEALKAHLTHHANLALETGSSVFDYPEEFKPNSPKQGRDQLGKFVAGHEEFRGKLTWGSVRYTKTRETKYNFQRSGNGLGKK